MAAKEPIESLMVCGGIIVTVEIFVWSSVIAVLFRAGARREVALLLVGQLLPIREILGASRFGVWAWDTN